MGRFMPSGNFSAQNSDSLNEIQQLTFFFPQLFVIVFASSLLPLVRIGSRNRRGEILPGGLFLQC